MVPSRHTRGPYEPPVMVEVAKWQLEVHRVKRTQPAHSTIDKYFRILNRPVTKENAQEKTDIALALVFGWPKLAEQVGQELLEADEKDKRDERQRREREKRRYRDELDRLHDRLAAGLT